MSALTVQEQSGEKKPETLVRIEDLFKDDQMMLQFKVTESMFIYVVNQPPVDKWLKEHPTAKKEIIALNDKGQPEKKKVPTKYIPIERVEWLLDNVIARYEIEIKNAFQIANSITVIVRLRYWHPVYKEWVSHDGIGAAPLQTNSGAGAIDWNQIKSNAVQIGAPAAKSYAVKDAAEQIGKLFGRDLNRAETLVYGGGIIDRYKEALKSDDEPNEPETPTE